ncbi:HincII family type II restriction endonuclease [Canibacter sp. lx-45]|uniref:HincII family type II restriction endonuclease n=1 Tax=Canibacter zhuwentaonis TaxID=2837491 RepID=UPI001BDD3338|nr:HincII family type II restriction endonuclease [Canibacter zhuwentaonis]MBT1034941.1 HincII family type II restriction endonuclease [Canibacter zhuwentaonis]
MNVPQLLQDIATKLTHAEAPRPSGQLSGHAGGLVFEGLAHKELVSHAPGRAFRHYEALNAALSDFVATGKKPESATFGEPALDYLVSRSKSATEKWKPSNPFEEKQNDTAESILFSDGELKFESPEVTLIDIKSQNASKPSQPPNIISANKLSQAAKLVLESGAEPKFDIYYLGVRFFPTERNGVKILKADEWCVVDLFKIAPTELYINWAAALQIQFHPFDVKQNYQRSKRDWFRDFLEHCYSKSLASRIAKQQKRLDEVLAILHKY